MQTFHKIQNVLAANIARNDGVQADSPKPFNDNKLNYATSNGADSDYDNFNLSPDIKARKNERSDWLPNKLEKKSLDLKYFKVHRMSNNQKKEDDSEVNLLKSSFERQTKALPKMAGMSKTPLREHNYRRIVKGERLVTDSNNKDDAMNELQHHRQKSVETEPAAMLKKSFHRKPQKQAHDAMRNKLLEGMIQHKKELPTKLPLKKKKSSPRQKSKSPHPRDLKPRIVNVFDPAKIVKNARMAAKDMANGFVLITGKRRLVFNSNRPSTRDNLTSERKI